MEEEINKIYDIAIVGGGIVGVATAYKIHEHYPDLHIILIEKEDTLAAHQTGHNSGVIHSGLYYKPGSLKAENCVKGRKELVAFAKKYGIQHDVCGKVVAAVDKSELPFMNKIYDNGIENKTEGLEKIDGNKLREFEPHVNAIAGIWVPCTGIIDYKSATEKMAEIALKTPQNNKLVLGEKVQDFNHPGELTEIITDKRKYRTKFLIVCGGLFSDKLALKDDIKLKEHIVGFRGDYYELTEQAKHKVKNLIYPVPNPDFPFLGIHFTRMVNGDVECGPNAVFTFKREGYKKTSFNLTDTFDALSYRGTWNLFFHNMQFGLNEYRKAFSKRLFLHTLQRLIPSLTKEDIQPGRAGVRALLLNRNGDTRDDFKIAYNDNAIHVLNAPSPAATASLAIGDKVREMAQEHFSIQ